MIINSIRQAFGATLTKLAKDNKNIYVVDVDLKSALFLTEFAQKYPDRFIECGVSETNAAGIAAGLSKTGKTVFLTSFACFSPSINWNTIKQSICYNHANVKIVGSHAGLMSADLGATHQMLEDISLMRTLPNLDVFAPLDALETEKMVNVLVRSPKNAYLRLVRPTTPNLSDSKTGFTIGKSHLLKTGKDITVIGYGPILEQALKAQAQLNLNSDTKNISLEIINCSSVKPLDSVTILKSLKKTGRLICLEDHQIAGSLGEAVAHLVLSQNIKCSFKHLAVNDSFGRSAKDYQELYNYYGIGVNNLIDAIKEIILK